MECKLTSCISMQCVIIWYELSQRVRTSRSNCMGSISTGAFWSTNSPFRFPFSIHVVKASRRCPEARIAMTILHTREMGSSAHAFLNDCAIPRASFVFAASARSSKSLSSLFSGASTEDISFRTSCMARLIACGKQMILLSLALNVDISRSRNNFLNIPAFYRLL